MVENRALCFEWLSSRRSSFTFSSTLCNNRFGTWFVLEKNAISSAKLLSVSGTTKYCLLCLFGILSLCLLSLCLVVKPMFVALFKAWSGATINKNGIYVSPRNMLVNISRMQFPYHLMGLKESYCTVFLLFFICQEH